MRFNSDAAFPLEIHGIEQLILFLALLNRAGAFKQPIGQGRLAMIDVRDNAKVARSLDSHEESHYAGAFRAGQFVAALPKQVFGLPSTGARCDCYLFNEMFRPKGNELSEPPQNLDRLSFRPRSKKRDPVRTALFIAAAIAFLTLLAGMIAVLTITPPTL